MDQLLGWEKPEYWESLNHLWVLQYPGGGRSGDEYQGGCLEELKGSGSDLWMGS